MKYISTLIAVSDMKKSKQFYHDVLGMKVVADFGANVTLDGGLVMQTMDKWKSFIRTDKVLLPNNAGELYFEEEDLDAFLEEHRWGQRVVRFYDPDRHIIEVGEKLNTVILRFMEQGLSAEETAIRMDIPLDFVTACLEKR